MTVRDQSAAVEAMAADWPIIDALLGGTPAMRTAGKTYLPQWPGETDEAYKARKNTATLFPAFARTVDVLCGKPFSKPLTYTDDIPVRIKAWCDDIDLQGRNLHAFAASICEEALSHGIAGILVDYPTAKGIRTKADESAAGLRPYFVQIHAGNLLGWRTKRINGAETFTQLRLLEQVIEDDGAFGEKTVEQVRVLYPGKWQTWRESEKVDADGKKVWILHDEGKTTLKVIPFVPVYGKRTNFMRSEPPLLELAYMNVEHWQSKSDQQTILHVARVPILFGRMLGSDTKIVVGNGSMISSDSEHGDLKYVEHSGLAIEAGRLSILDLEDRMRQVGAELLVIKPGNTTVAQTMSDNEPGMCALQRLVQDAEDGIDAALQLMASWVGERQGGHVQIFQDFGVASLAEASMDLLRDMNVDGTLSDETLFLEAQRRGLIKPEVKWEDEKVRIKANAIKPGTVAIAD
jgi:hypothetical protein